MTNSARSVDQPELVSPLGTAGGATPQAHSCSGCPKDSQGVGGESDPALVMTHLSWQKVCWGPPNLWVNIQHTPVRHMSRVLLQRGN